jgi:hypothetical protein
MREKSINYVVACWMGPRRFQDPRANEDPWYYIKLQLEWLAKIPHKIDQITFVLNLDRMVRPVDFWNLVGASELKPLIQFFTRPNVGISYGIFNDVVKHYGARFDAYILNEDDYVFAEPNFDAFLEERLFQDPKLGCVCGLVGGAGAPPKQITDDSVMKFGVPHPSAFFGLYRTETLLSIIQKSGRLPHYDQAQVVGNPDAFNQGLYGPHQQEGQIGYGPAINSVGYTLGDWLDTYSTCFWNQDIIRWAGNPFTASFVLPVHVLGKTDLRFEGKQGRGRIDPETRKFVFA